MRFFDLYLAALYDAIEAGGDQTAVERVIAEVNNPTQEGLTAYLQTLTPPAVPCGVCGVPFEFSHANPTLEEEVLCPGCRALTPS